MTERGGGRIRVTTTPSQIQAKFRREVNRIEKNQRQMEQKYRVSERKNTATQRGIISLLGDDVYLDPGIKDASVLYGQNIPGFCYRRNGDARRPCSIYESKTTRVIHTLDGREDILEEVASNVVSDNPLLDEILSSPQVLPILCDLRTMALLGRNPPLLAEFVEGLREEGDPLHLLLFPNNEDPLNSLKRHRAVLIQDLFDAIRILVELRLNSEVLYENPPPHPGNSERQPTAEIWNEVLLTKLQVLAAEEKGETPQVTNQELPESAESPVQEYWKVDPISSAPDLGVSLEKCVASSAANLRKLPNPGNKFLGPSPAQLKLQRRAAFERTVKELIVEINNVVHLGKMIREVGRKNPCRAHCSTGLLEKLLKKEVFTSLNLEYCSLLRDHGQLDTLEYEQCLAPELSGGVRTPPSFNFDQILDKFNTHTHPPLQENSKERKKTRSRLCCPACKAKLRLGYEKFRERDDKFQKQIEQGGKGPYGRLGREIEKMSGELAGAQPMVTFDFVQPIRTVQDTSLLDVTSFNTFSLPMSMSGVDGKWKSSPATSPPMPSVVKVFPDLATDLVSYAPSPMPTVPVTSPGPPPPALTLWGTKKSSVQPGRAKVPGQTSWTLKVSRFDLFKLRHELQRVAIEDRMLELTRHLYLQNAEDGQQNQSTPKSESG